MSERYWKTKTIEIPADAARRAVELVVAFCGPLFGRGDSDKDARDPHQPFWNGTWAPPGEIHHFDDPQDFAASAQRNDPGER